ncbi:MAG: hypothetical protein NZV14_14520 [Bryobacteraceae bacterium]|nr:hypothetical protein [Bryobacteraceae bacterium]MDW8379377.1 hypothetical protein [Bryobacterales bacterium]
MLNKFTRRSALASLFGGVTAAQSHLPGLPNIGFRADTGPPRSECGVGALMPWADSLWAVTYNSHTPRTGTGLGLYRIDEKLQPTLVHIHDGTHANRMIHKESSQAFIGPYAIDAKGNWRFLEEFKNERITATMRHLFDPSNRIYHLTMEGLLYEIDVGDLKRRLVVDLVKELRLNARPHFKGGYTGQGRVIVAANGFYEYGGDDSGLHEWDGKRWNRLSGKPHMECAGRENLGNVVFATGWDEASTLFWALVKGQWQRYRLPRPSAVYMQAWQTEWMRIREVETEHFLMDIHGMFFELTPVAWQNAVWGVLPVCHHLRTIPDYCAFRGLLALGGNQTTPNGDANFYVGQPQSGVWFCKTDDLWSWGKPKGWGGPWRRTQVQAGQPSDPFLMTGFDKKMLHLRTDRVASFALEYDFLGDGDWIPYEKITTAGPKNSARLIFPEGFSAHWIRIVPETTCAASAEFFFS